MELLSTYLDSIDSRNFAFAGFFLYVLMRWAVQSNKKQRGLSRKSWGKWLNHEKEEWLSTFVGSLMFGYFGDYVIISLGKLLNHFNVLPFGLYLELYTSLEEFTYLIGGAVFGTILLLGVQYLLNTASKKLEK